MKVYLNYGEKSIALRPYNTAVERDILVYTTLNDEPKLDDMLEIVEDYIYLTIEELKNLSTEEKYIILFKLRSISIGEEIDIKYKCSCGTVNDTFINISELVEEPSVQNNIVSNQFKPLTHDNLQEFVNIDVDELELDEYDKLYEEVKTSTVKFIFELPVTCIKCHEQKLVKIDTLDYITSCLSEDTLMSLYQTTSDLVFFGTYTKSDIDNMIPFERSIFISILNKTREDLNK